jgi:octopine/nopaline transport system substrate-binding protein
MGKKMHAKILRRAVLALSAICLSTTAWAAETKSITIALEGAYAPWNITNPDGSMGGFEPALAKVLCERAKLDCKLVAADWDGMIPALNAGKFDVIMDAMSITEERKAAIDFSVPYAATRSRFVTLASGSLVHAPDADAVVHLNAGETGNGSFEDLRAFFKGKVIGIQAATHYSEFVRDHFGDVAEVREYKTAPERDIDLESGRLDLIIDNTVYLANALDSAKGTLAFTGPEVAGSIWGAGIGLGLRKSDGPLRAELDKAIESVRSDGTLSKLSMQFLKTDVSPQ